MNQAPHKNQRRRRDPERLYFDPMLRPEQKASPGRIFLYATGALVILGVVFYGLSQPPFELPRTTQEATSGATGTAANEAAPQVTPAASTTTGAASSDDGTQKK